MLLWRKWSHKVNFSQYLWSNRVPNREPSLVGFPRAATMKYQVGSFWTLDFLRRRLSAAVSRDQVCNKLKRSTMPPKLCPPFHPPAVSLTLTILLSVRSMFNHLSKPCSFHIMGKSTQPMTMTLGENCTVDISCFPPLLANFSAFRALPPFP